MTGHGIPSRAANHALDSCPVPGGCIKCWSLGPATERRPVLCLDGSIAEPWFAEMLKRIYSAPNQDYANRPGRFEDTA